MARNASSGQECVELPRGHLHSAAKMTLSGQCIQQQGGGRAVKLAPNDQESAWQPGGRRVVGCIKCPEVFKTFCFLFYFVPLIA